MGSSLKNRFESLIHDFADTVLQGIEPLQEISRFCCDGRATTIPASDGAFNELHAEPVFHGFDVAPSASEGNSNLLRGLIDRPVLVDGMQQEAAAATEHGFSFDLDPDL
jgi:hypothetical protein